MEGTQKKYLGGCFLNQLTSLFKVLLNAVIKLISLLHSGRVAFFDIVFFLVLTLRSWGGRGTPLPPVEAALIARFFLRN